MMEHSSVTLRWMGLRFHQLQGEKGRDKQESREPGEDRSKESKESKMRGEEGRKGKEDRKIERFVLSFFRQVKTFKKESDHEENPEVGVTSHAPCVFTPGGGGEWGCQVMICSALSL